MPCILECLSLDLNHCSSYSSRSTSRSTFRSSLLPTPPHSSHSKLRNCCGLWRNLYLVVGVGSGDPIAPLTWRRSKHSSPLARQGATEHLQNSDLADYLVNLEVAQNAHSDSQISYLVPIPGCSWTFSDQHPGYCARMLLATPRPTTWL